MPTEDGGIAEDTVAFYQDQANKCQNDGVQRELWHIDGNVVTTYNLLSSAVDAELTVRAVRIACSIMHAPALARLQVSEIAPGPDRRTDDEIIDWVKKVAETTKSIRDKYAEDFTKLRDEKDMQVRREKTLETMALGPRAAADREDGTA